MSDPALAMQGAIVTALRTDAGVIAIAQGRIFDRVQPDAAFPYVSLGPSDVTQADATCILGSDVTMQVDVWSREPGFVQVRQLGDAVRKALHNLNVTADGYSFEIEHQVTRYFREADGLTSHGVLTFTAAIDTGNS